MRSIPARILGAGLGALFLPACFGLHQQYLPDGQPVAATMHGMPAATVMRRVAPEPAPAAAHGVQYVAVPITLVSPPKPEPVAALPAHADTVEVVAVTHTSEPPLAALQPFPPSAAFSTPPAPTPRLTAATPAAAGPAIKTAPLPTPYAVTDQAVAKLPPLERLPAPGLSDQTVAKPVAPEPAASATQPSITNQPVGPEIKTASHTSPAEALLTPPVPPEELKLVSVPKNTPASACGGPLQTALRAYQEKAPQEASKHLAHLDPANQDLLRKVLPLAARLGDTPLPVADPAETAELADQLQQVVTSLRAKAALRIEKLSYCRLPAAPARAGAYQPLPEDHAFRPGETVELYMEVRNFSCEAKDREFLTHLTTAIEVRDDRGELVNRYEFEREKPDAGQAPRQDYFHICRFPVQGLPPGQYTLTAQVTDVPTGKSAKKSLELRVEPARRAARGTAE